jgi:hypothetical protein
MFTPERTITLKMHILPLISKAVLYLCNLLWLIILHLPVSLWPGEMSTRLYRSAKRFGGRVCLSKLEPDLFDQ